MKRIISILLALIVCFSVVACKDDTITEEPKVTVSDKYMLQNGMTDYQIVVPQEISDSESTACDELRLLFSEATGINLQVVTDTGLAFDSESKYLSIGQTNVLETADISVSDTTYEKAGFQITTKGNSIFFISNNEYGVVFAVYEFLFRTLNFEQFSADCYSLDKGVTDMPLYIFNLVDAPDFPDYMAIAGFMNIDYGVCRRMKAVNMFNLRGLIAGHGGHNTLLLLDTDVYNNSEDAENYHPEWYSTGGTQLCYLARGNEQSLELMISTAAQNLTKYIKQQPEKRQWLIGNMDDHRCCTCDFCKDTKAVYGCETAQQIWWMNRLYDKMMEWFATPEGKEYYHDDFKLVTSFYEKYVDAPAKFNEKTGKYEPIDSSVVLKKGVAATIAPAYANWQVPLSDETNKVHFTQVQKVAACAEEMATFIYASNFLNYLYPYDNFNSMQKNYQLLYDLGVKTLTDETQVGQYAGMTGFHMLKAYLSAQFAWDVNQDQDTLIERYFDAYFMDAADDMLKYFNSYRDFSQLQMNGLCPGIGRFDYKIGVKDYWPRNVIATWQGYIDDALSKIEKYKTIDSETYQMLYKHITLERIFLDFVYIDLYGEAVLGSEYKAICERFVANVRLNDLQMIRENVPIEDYLQGLA